MPGDDSILAELNKQVPTATSTTNGGADPVLDELNQQVKKKEPTSDGSPSKNGSQPIAPVGDLDKALTGQPQDNKTMAVNFPLERQPVSEVTDIRSINQPPVMTKQDVENWYNGASAQLDTQKQKVTAQINEVDKQISEKTPSGNIFTAIGATPQPEPPEDLKVKKEALTNQLDDINTQSAKLAEKKTKMLIDRQADYGTVDNLTTEGLPTKKEVQLNTFRQNPTPGNLQQTIDESTKKYLGDNEPLSSHLKNDALNFLKDTEPQHYAALKTRIDDGVATPKELYDLEYDGARINILKVNEKLKQLGSKFSTENQSLIDFKKQTDDLLSTLDVTNKDEVNKYHQKVDEFDGLLKQYKDDPELKQYDDYLKTGQKIIDYQSNLLNKYPSVKKDVIDQKVANDVAAMNLTGGKSQKIVSNSAKELWNGVMSLTTSIVKSAVTGAAVAANLVEPELTNSDNERIALEKAMNFLDESLKQSKITLPEEEQKPVFNSLTDITWSNIIPHLMGTLPILAFYGLSDGIGGLAVKSGTLAAETSANLGTTYAAFAQVFGDSYDEYLNLNPNDADGAAYFGMFNAITTTILFKSFEYPMMKSGILFDARKVGLNDMVNSIANGVNKSQAIKDGVMSGAKFAFNAAKNAGIITGLGVANSFNQYVANQTSGKNIFPISVSLGDYAKEFVSNVLTFGGLGVGDFISDVRKPNPLNNYALFQAGNLPLTFSKIIEDKFSSGKINKEQRDHALFLINASAHALINIPKDLNINTRLSIFPLAWQYDRIVNGTPTGKETPASIIDAADAKKEEINEKIAEEIKKPTVKDVLGQQAIRNGEIVTILRDDEGNYVADNGKKQYILPVADKNNPNEPLDVLGITPITDEDKEQVGEVKSQNGNTFFISLANPKIENQVGDQVKLVGKNGKLKDVEGMTDADKLGLINKFLKEKGLPPREKLTIESHTSEDIAARKSKLEQITESLNNLIKSKQNATPVRSNTGQVRQEGAQSQGLQDASGKDLQLDEKNKSKAAQATEQARKIDHNYEGNKSTPKENTQAPAYTYGGKNYTVNTNDNGEITSIKGKTKAGKETTLNPETKLYKSIAQDYETKQKEAKAGLQETPESTPKQSTGIQPKVGGTGEPISSDAQALLDRTMAAYEKMTPDEQKQQIQDIKDKLVNAKENDVSPYYIEAANEFLRQVEAPTETKVTEPIKLATHKQDIHNKFRQQFETKGVPKEQIDGAIALMEARAKSWASEQAGRNPDEWYQQIADVKNGEFESGDIQYQKGGLKAIAIGALSALHPTETGDVSHVKNIDVEKPKTEQIDKTIKENESNIYLKDSRDIDESTGRKLTDRNKFSGKYDKKVIDDIIEIAHKNDIDPYTFLAMALQESTLGTRAFHHGEYSDTSTSTTDTKNFIEEKIRKDDPDYGHYLFDIPYQRIDVLNSDAIPQDFLDEDYFNKYLKGLDESGIRKHILQLQADFFKDRLKEADRLGFNTTEAQKLQSWNGYPNKEFIENSPFGKRVIDLRENVIKKNSEIVKDVDAVTKTVAYQEQGGIKRGATETLQDGKVVIHALNSPDVSTMVHEIGHVFEKDLTDIEKKTVEDFGGSEKFARGFEKYLRDGKAPTEQLKGLFEKFKTWLTNIYQSLKGSPISGKITPEIKAIFDRLLSEAPTETKVTEPIEPEETKPVEATEPQKQQEPETINVSPEEIESGINAHLRDIADEFNNKEDYINHLRQSISDFNKIKAQANQAWEESLKPPADKTLNIIDIDKNTIGLTGDTYPIFSQLGKNGIGGRFNKAENRWEFDAYKREDVKKIVDARNAELEKQKAAEIPKETTPPGAVPPTATTPPGDVLSNYPPRQRELAVMKRLLQSKKLSQAEKQGFESKGLKYDVSNQQRAHDIAKSLIDDFGVDDMLDMARTNSFSQDVNTFIYGEAIDRTAKATKDKNLSANERQALAQKEADIAYEFANRARDLGTGISAIAYFYRRSPLGLQKSYEKIVQEQRNNFFRSQEKNIKSAYDDLSDDPRYAALLKENQKLKDALSNRKPVINKERLEKIDKFFDGLYDKLTKPVAGAEGARQAAGIPPIVLKGAINAMKELAKGGSAAADVLKAGVDYINDKFKEAWDVKDFTDKVSPGIEALLSDSEQKDWERILKALQPEKKKASSKQETKYTETLAKISKLDSDERNGLLRGTIGKLNRDGLITDEDLQAYKDGKKTLPDLMNELGDSQREIAIDYINGLADNIISAKEGAKDDAAMAKKLGDTLGTSVEAQQKILKKWEKKLQGLTPEQRGKFLSGVISHLINNGALDYDTFRNMFADALGLPKLDDVTIQKLQDLSDTKNKADDLASELKDDPNNPELLNQYKKAKENSDLAAIELQKLFSKEDGWFDKSIWAMRMNTLTPATQGMAMIGNFLTLVPRTSIGLYSSLVDIAINNIPLLNKFFDDNPFHRVNYFLSAKNAPKYFGQSASKAIREFWTGVYSRRGVANGEFTQKTVVHPLESASKMWNLRPSFFGGKGKGYLSGKEYANLYGHLLFNSTAGAFAESMTRLINFTHNTYGDFHAKMLTESFGRQLGLKGTELETFMALPPEEAQQIIEQKAKTFTYQQNNLLTSAIQKISNLNVGKGTTAGIAGKAGKALLTTQFPFARFSINYWLFNMELHSPEYCALRALNGIRTHNREEFTSYMGKAITGISMRFVAGKLAANGLFSPQVNYNSQDNNHKFSAEDMPAGHFNLQGYFRMLGGGDPAYQNGDFTVNQKWLGIIGEEGVTAADKYRELPYDKAAAIDNDFWGNYFQNSWMMMDYDYQHLFSEGAFGSSMNLINGLTGGQKAINDWAKNSTNIATNTVYPETLVQGVNIIRTSPAPNLKEYSEDKNPLVKTLKNVSVTSANTVFDRLGFGSNLFTGEVFAPIINEFGQPVPRTSAYTAAAGTKTVYEWGFKVGELYDHSDNGKGKKDAAFLPPEIPYKIGMYDLTPGEHSEFAELVGQLRSTYISAAEDDSHFLEEDDKSDIKTQLNNFYKLGYEQAVDMFVAAHPDKEDEIRSTPEK